jgi:hypothetical protein
MSVITRRQWSHRVIRHATGNVPPPHAVNCVVAWCLAESGISPNDGDKGPAYNPLCTTLRTSQVVSPDWNSVGVRNYGTLEAGIDATVATLLQDNFHALRFILGSPNVSAGAVAEMIAKSQWGTGDLIFRALDSYRMDKQFFETLPVGSM